MYLENIGALRYYFTNKKHHVYVIISLNTENAIYVGDSFARIG